MPSKKMIDALNSHMKEEFYSGYFYLAMEAYFRDQNLPGFAKWFRVQAGEELGHALKFYGYIAEVGARIVLQPIAAPKKDFASAKAIFEEGLAHEKKVSAAIRKLMDLAKAEKDYATEIFLQWFINEQVEEEANFTQALSMVALGGDGRGILVLDHQFGKRAEEKE
jgi:ferritin